MMREQQFALQKEPQVLLRPATGSKFALKEKFVQVYEAFFIGDDPSLDKPSFWDELFLLKVNHAFLSQCMAVTNEEQLLALRDNLNKVFLHCLKYMRDESPVRARNAMETMCVIVRGLCSKKFGNIGFDVINLLTGVDHANAAFKELVDNVNAILLSPEQPVLLKQAVLRVLGVILTGVENMNANSIVDYLMIHDVFHSLTHVVNDSTTVTLAYDAVVILTLLANYKKYEGRNPYLNHLIALENVAVLKSLASTLAFVFDDYFGYFNNNIPESTKGGIQAAMFSDLYSWFSGSASTIPKPDPGTMPYSLSGALLAFYEIVHANAVLRSLLLQNGVVGRRGVTLKKAPANPKQAPEASPLSPVLPDETSDPLLSSFLSLLTVAAHATFTSPDALQQVILGLYALQKLVEDDVALAAMFDKQKTTRVMLVQKRLRKFPLNSLPQPFACHLYDAVTIILWASLRKPLPTELLVAGLGVLHRAVVYQRRMKIRLAYASWSSMFECLIALVEKSNAQVDKDESLWAVVEGTLRLLELVILHGDDFVQLALSYDQLIYQVLRAQPAFEELKKRVAQPRPANAEGPLPANKASIQVSIEQMLTVHAYFSTKLEASRILAGGYILTAEQVLKVIRDNLEGLALQERDVDSYERYAENPKHLKFFRLLLRSVVADYRSWLPQ